MGIEHRSRPLWGVQFHPESIATEHGRKLVENFYALARRHRAARAAAREHAPRAAAAPTPAARTRRWHSTAAARALARGRAVDRAAVRTAVRRRRARLLAGQRRRADARSRSARSSAPRAGPDRCVLEYDVARESRDARIARMGPPLELGSHLRRARPGAGQSTRSSPPAGMPRGLLGGYVGYLGYECKADCGSPNVHRSDVPDAVLMLANRVIAVDHVGPPHACGGAQPGRRDGRRALAGRRRGGRARGDRRAGAGTAGTAVCVAAARRRGAGG